MRRPALAVLLVVGLGLLVFLIQNQDPVTIRFLAWRAVTSRALVVLLALGLGVLLGLLGTWPRRRG